MSGCIGKLYVLVTSLSDFILISVLINWRYEMNQFKFSLSDRLSNKSYLVLIVMNLVRHVSAVCGWSCWQDPRLGVARGMYCTL